MTNQVALTQRQKDALRVLLDLGTDVSPSLFAEHFWPGKKFTRGNGPWGLGPDTSGRLGGRMLQRLLRFGLIRVHDRTYSYTAEINHAGREALQTGMYTPKGQQR